jgi:hypothetical protein
MSDRKLRLVAQNSTLVPQPKDDGFAQVDCAQVDCAQVNRGQVSGADKADRPATAKENLRLIKAFNLIADNRRRTWLVELVEHFASLESMRR